MHAQRNGYDYSISKRRVDDQWTGYSLHDFKLHIHIHRVELDFCIGNHLFYIQYSQFIGGNIKHQ